jgi:ABC-type Fe3+/spermidine/putrescine transport system ATPase subunit
MKVIAGNFRPSHGTMRMEGAELVLHRPVEARQHGIEIIYQDLALCDNLTAAANVFLARESLKGVGPLSFLDDAAMCRRAARPLARREGRADLLCSPDDVRACSRGAGRSAAASPIGSIGGRCGEGETGRRAAARNVDAFNLDQLARREIRNECPRRNRGENVFKRLHAPLTGAMDARSRRRRRENNTRAGTCTKQ